MWNTLFLTEREARSNKNMMMAPEQFENASYQEILKVKNELVSEIS